MNPHFASLVLGLAHQAEAALSGTLPALFLIVVTPLAVFVASGAGTHMSPLMLYPFALPWALPFQESRPGTEIQALLAGCAINTVLITFAGLLLDWLRAAKAASASRRDDSARP